MLLPILLITILFISAALIVHKLVQKKYDKFVLQNSPCLKKLQEINCKYKFHPHIDFDQDHTYDNENMYDDISCTDYLIYQLQFLSNKVLRQINKEKQNSRLYTEYLKEIAALPSLGNYLVNTKKLNHKRLVKTEKRLLQKKTFTKPPMDFCIEVTLYCAQINGRVYDYKTKMFQADTILVLIKRLQNRRGTFYNDREIWNSICRVERGKVSNKMRFSIYQRDGYRCCNCGVTQRYAQLEIDHIIPIAKGGKSTYDNLQTLCHECNVEKGDSLQHQ